MTPRELFEAIGLVDDSLVLEADAPAAGMPRPWLAVARRWVPLAACLCLVAGGAVLALRSGVLGGKASGNVLMSGATADAAAPRSGEAAAPAPAAGAAGNGAAAGGAEPGAAEPEDAPNALESTEGTADGADAGKAVYGAVPEHADSAGNVMYWGSQLEPALQEALWGDGEAEPWQDVLAALPAEVQPGAEPATLPVLCDGKSIGQYALCSQTDAQTLLFDGAFLSAEGVPRGGTNPANALDAELVYNPAGAALRVPMWAFTVPTDMDYGDVVCYVPAVDLEILRQLVLDRYGG